MIFAQAFVTQLPYVNFRFTRQILHILTTAFFFGSASSRFFLAEGDVKGKDERAKSLRVRSLLERPALILTSLPFYGLPRRLAFANSKGIQINSFSRAKQ